MDCKSRLKLAYTVNSLDESLQIWHLVIKNEEHTGVHMYTVDVPS